MAKINPAELSPNSTSYALGGNPDGPPLIFIHGLGLSRQTWDGFLPALEGEYRLITYDLFGHGESALPPTPPDLTLFSEQIISLMNHLGIKDAVMVGFSLGGMINRRIALDHPDRVAGLVILNSPHERGATEQAKVEERARMTAEEGISSTIEQTLTRWFTPDFIASNPAAVDKVRQGVLANQLDAYAACRYVLAAGVVELIRPSTPITAPTLVMTCAKDSGSTPAMSEAIASEIPASILSIIPALQHMGLVEQPKLFLEEMIPFLHQHRRSS